MPKKTDADKIIQAASEVWALPANEADELAFMSRCFIQATLPHSDPGRVEGWGRRSGHYALSLQPGGYLGKDNKWVNVGLPYGSIPRLILAWLNAEVVKTNSQHIVLGRSFSDFVQKLGYNTNAGRGGDMTRIKTQSLRLFSSKISMIYDGPQGFALEQALLAKKALFFWDPKKPDQQSLWDSEVFLSEEFFKVLQLSPVPLDWRVLKALKRSPMAIDLYFWLSHRMYSIKKPQRLRWESLAAQLGSEYSEIRFFRRSVREQARKIKAIWQDLNIDLDNEETIELRPSRLLIPPK